MADTINIATRLAQTSITQFFPRVNETDVPSQSIHDLETPIGEVPNQMQNAQSEEAHHATAVRAGSKDENLPTAKAKNIRVFQLNTAKRTGSGSALARLMGACNHSLAFVTEPPLVKGKLCGFSGLIFNSFLHPGNTTRCRAAIIASKGIEVCPLAAFTDEDTSSALAYINGRLTCIVSSYMDGTVDHLPEMLHKVCHYAAVNRYGLLICTDSNGHSPLWGSPTQNPRGRLVEEDLIYRYGLQLLNQGNDPTFIGHRATDGTIIDLTLACPRTAASLSEWRVSSDAVISDHSLIRFRTLSKIQNKVTWDFRKADWVKFQDSSEFLSKRWVPIQDWKPDTLDRELKSWDTDINKALEFSCPKTKGHGCPPNKRGRSCPWWSKELEELKRAADKDHKNFMRWKRNLSTDTSRPPDEGERLFELKKAAETLYMRSVRKAKRASWKKTTSSIESPADMAKFCKGAFRKQRVSLGLLKKPDGEMTKSPEESLQVIFDTLFPDSVALEQTVDHRPILSPDIVKMPKGPTLYSDHMMKTAIKKFGSFKAAGMDGIKPIVHEHLGWYSRRRLTYIMEASTRLAYVPKRWRKSRIVLVPKPNRVDYALVKSWRPLTMLPATFKLHELLQKWNLEDSQRDRPKSKIQHAFTEGKGTDTAIADFVNNLERTVLRDEHCISISLDVDGAFNKTRQMGVVESMRDEGHPDIFTNWYESFLMNQIACVDMGIAKSSRGLTRGVPQGALTSPRAWNTYFEPVLQEANKGPGKVVAYADDFTISFAGPDLDTVQRIAQQALTKIVKVGGDRGITFNPGKTVVMHSGNDPNPEGSLKELSMSGQSIPYSDEMIYLGMKITRNLDFTLHLEEKIKSAKRKLMALRTAIGKFWGPKPSLMLWAYKQVVLPALTYGCFVYAHKVGSKSKERLKKVGRLANLLLAPIARSAPTGGLEVITGTAPIHIQMINISKNTVLRIGQPKPVWDGLTTNGSKGFYRYWSDEIPDSITRVKPDKCQTLFNWVPGRTMTMKLPDPNKQVGSMGVKTVHDPDACWRVNVHAVEWDDSIGVSHVLIHPDDIILEESNRRYRSEVGRDGLILHQIVAALESLLEDVTLLEVGSNVVVSSSFSRTLLAAPLIRKQSLANLVETARLVNQRTGNPVYFVKNDKCDAKSRALELAKSAQELELCQSPFYNQKVVKKVLEDLRDKEWQYEWTHSGSYHSITGVFLPYADQTKQWFPEAGTTQWMSIMKYGRPTVGSLIQFITGHGWFGRHRSKFDEDFPYLCRFCKTAREDPEHLWSSCRNFSGVRYAIRELCKDDNSSVSFNKPFVWSVTQLVRFFRDPKMANLLTGPRTNQQPL